MNNFKCFLASNSAEGFISHFADCYDPADGWHSYIIKGGPGTGKSSFMKKVLSVAKERHLSFIEVYCASDPTSLDGVILPHLKTVFMDGTAPHVVEPKFPGVCENLLDFGVFWNSSVLRDKGCEIISATKNNKLCHKKAGEFIKKAGEIMKDSADLSVLPDYITAEKHIPEKGTKGRMLRCFLGGITPDGVLYFTDHIKAERQITLDGKGAEKTLRGFKERALSCGFDTVCFENPIIPTLTDGVFIPELSLFAVRSKFLPENEEFLRYITLASEEIAKAKMIHDELESYYISAMDYDALNRFTDEFIIKMKER